MRLSLCGDEKVSGGVVVPRKGLARGCLGFEKVGSRQRWGLPVHLIGASAGRGGAGPHHRHRGFHRCVNKDERFICPVEFRVWGDGTWAGSKEIGFLCTVVIQ